MVRAFAISFAVFLQTRDSKGIIAPINSIVGNMVGNMVGDIAQTNWAKPFTQPINAITGHFGKTLPRLFSFDYPTDEASPAFLYPTPAEENAAEFSKDSWLEFSGKLGFDPNSKSMSEDQKGYLKQLLDTDIAIANDPQKSDIVNSALRSKVFAAVSAELGKADPPEHSHMLGEFLSSLDAWFYAVNKEIDAAVSNDGLPDEQLAALRRKERELDGRRSDFENSVRKGIIDHKLNEGYRSSQVAEKAFLHLEKGSNEIMNVEGERKQLYQIAMNKFKDYLTAFDVTDVRGRFGLSLIFAQNVLKRLSSDKSTANNASIDPEISWKIHRLISALRNEYTSVSPESLAEGLERKKGSSDWKQEIRGGVIEQILSDMSAQQAVK